MTGRAIGGLTTEWGLRKPRLRFPERSAAKSRFSRPRSPQLALNRGDKISKEPVDKLGDGAIATGATEVGIARDLTGKKRAIALTGTSEIEGCIVGNDPARDRRRREDRRAILRPPRSSRTAAIDPREPRSICRFAQNNPP